MQKTRVLVVGAGPAGLTSALLLARFGVQVTLIEKHSSTSIHPKARGLNVRTMEILRSLGLEESVREAGRALEKNRYMLFVESLAGTEIRRILDDDLMMKGDALAEYTPCVWTQCSQDVLERLLLEQARKAGADIRFSSEVLSFDQDGENVRCTVRASESGEEYQLDADYLLACDGSNSPIRRALDIPLEGRSAIEHFVNIYFRCDLRKYSENRWFGICFVENDRTNGLFLPVDNEHKWLFNVRYDPEKESVDSFTNARCVQLLEAAIGGLHGDLEILSVLPWVASALVVPRLRSGRAFLLGDAAHVMPPAGGFGLNIAIQDAHNLAWKLAWVLQGKAADGLLQSYEQERLPVARTVVEYAERELDAAQPWEHGDAAAAEGAETSHEGDHNSPWEQSLEDQLKAVIGFQYHSDAVASGEPLQGIALRCQPGTRFPHVQTVAGRSTLDFLPQGFAVVTAKSDLAETGDPSLPTVQLKLEEWERAVEGAPLEGVLVRPDGIVAAAGSLEYLTRQQTLLLAGDSRGGGKKGVDSARNEDDKLAVAGGR